MQEQNGVGVRGELVESPSESHLTVGPMIHGHHDHSPGRVLLVALQLVLSRHFGLQNRPQRHLRRRRRRLFLFLFLFLSVQTRILLLRKKHDKRSAAATPLEADDGFSQRSDRNRHNTIRFNSSLVAFGPCAFRTFGESRAKKSHDWLLCRTIITCGAVQSQRNSPVRCGPLYCSPLQFSLLYITYLTP